MCKIINEAFSAVGDLLQLSHIFLNRARHLIDINGKLFEFIAAFFRHTFVISAARDLMDRSIDPAERIQHFIDKQQ